MKKQNLQDYLKNKLTFTQFEQLPQDLNISKKKFTRLVNGIDQWSAENFKALIISIEFELNPNELFHKVEIKTSITIDEMQQLNEWYESQS